MQQAREKLQEQISIVSQKSSDHKEQLSKL